MFEIGSVVKHSDEYIRDTFSENPYVSNWRGVVTDCSSIICFVEDEEGFISSWYLWELESE